MSRSSERNRATTFELFYRGVREMTVDGLSWFPIAVRVVFLIALLSYAAVVAWRLLGRFGGLVGRRPRVVAIRPPRPPTRIK